MINVTIVEPCPVFRTGLFHYLNSIRDVKVIINQAESVDLAQVVVARSVQATTQFNYFDPTSWVIILEDIAEAKVWLAQGVMGLVTTMIEPAELALVIQQVARGQRAVSKAVLEWLVNEQTPPQFVNITPDEMLTEREQEVLTLIVQGLANQEIAETLAVSLSTVKSHVSHIFAKVGVKSRAQLICWAKN